MKPFSQQSVNNKRKYGGLSLGLVMLKGIIENANGIITRDSLTNRSAACTFSIPFEAVNQKQEKGIIRLLPTTF